MISHRRQRHSRDDRIADERRDPTLSSGGRSTAVRRAVAAQRQFDEQWPLDGSSTSGGRRRQFDEQ